MTPDIQLKGKLSDFQLHEIVQLLHLGRKSGELALFGDDHAPAGSIFLIQGELVHAVLGESRGVAAFARIMMLDHGYFTFLADRISRELTIERPIEALLMEAHARHDERVRFRAELPPPEAVLSLAGNVADIPRLDIGEWQVLSLVNGRRTIARIVEKSGDEHAALGALHSLFAKGLLKRESATSPLDGLIPWPLPAAQASGERPYPPRLRTNLLLKAIDGRTAIGRLAESLQLEVAELAEDIRLLLELNWIRFGAEDRKVWDQCVQDRP
jgi:hypothetical protein